MKILITAGNTLALIDKVRCLTNIFTGRTGATIAECAVQRGHEVTLLTSGVVPKAENPKFRAVLYKTFEDLQGLMQQHLCLGETDDSKQTQVYDVLIHCAAVSDYLFGGVYSAAEGTRFSVEEECWYVAGAESATPARPTLENRSAGKVKSDVPELWLRLVRAPKLVDLVRDVWKFRGRLVKFKLEVGLSDEDLLRVAEASRQHSKADLMVANTLEGAAEYAFIGPPYQRVERQELAAVLMDQLEGRS